MRQASVTRHANEVEEQQLISLAAKVSFEDCLLLDAVQKGHQLNDVDAQNLLSHGLIEVQDDQYYISLDVARKTKQVPEYTKVKGLDKSKLKQMILQFLQNSGQDGARREHIYTYHKDVLPSNKTEEQQLRIVCRLLVEMHEEGTISKNGLKWSDSK